MLLHRLAGSFPATFVVLCAMAYANYALSVAWSRIYVARGRQFLVVEVFEDAPRWQTALQERPFWTWRLLVLFVVLAVVAGLFALFGIVAARLPSAGEEMALAVRDGALALWLGAYLAMIAGHVRNVAAHSLLREGLVTGNLRYSAEYTYGLSVWQYVMLAVPMIGLALVDPGPATIGFACGPLFVAMRTSLLGRRRRWA